MRVRELLAALVLVFGLQLCAQDLSGPFGQPLSTTASVAPTAAALPIPQTATDPGYEGAYVMDSMYIYTYHNGLWCKTQRLKF